MLRRLHYCALFLCLIFLIMGGFGVTLTLLRGSEADIPASFLERTMVPGPIQAGHAELSCTDCHTPAPGSIRQQIQKKVYDLLGSHDDIVDFGYQAVATAICLDCHNSPYERHPVHRFKEPRFIEAVSEIDARDCLNCHTEHSGNRLKLTDLGFCSACHADLIIKNDPLDRPHVDLISAKDWESCLGCHDFHGNHKRQTQTHYRDRFNIQRIQDYLNHGPNPYASTKQYLARTQR